MMHVVSSLAHSGLLTRRRFTILLAMAVGGAISVIVMGDEVEETLNETTQS